MSLRTLLFFAVLAAVPMGARAATAAASATPRVDATFAAWDTDKDHQLSLAEFRAGSAALQQAAAVEVALHRQFQAMDADHTGALEAAEYSTLVLVKRAGKAAPPLSAFDANKDQRLQFIEYVQLVRRLGAQSPATGAGK
jgi:hypothetical protein